MKKLFFLSLLLITFLGTNAQGTITGFSHDPISPTASDSITFFVELHFTSGDCELSSSSISVNDSTILASALHCLGPLTFICSIIDTFKIGPQSSGNYTFDMTLSSGSNPTPCSPAFAPDDSQVFQFSVSPSTQITYLNNSNTIKIAPNPAKNYTTIEVENSPVTLSLYNSLGILVDLIIIENKNYRLDTQLLPKGLYIYSITTAKGPMSGKLIVE